MNNGTQGELLFQQIMESRNYTVANVSNDERYWDKDIDFIVTSPTSGLTKSFEVKWDSKINKTGNLYLEIANIHSKGGKGWYEFCQADYLAYGDASNGTFYIVSLLELRERVKKLQPRQINCGFDSVGLLVSLDDISDITEIL